MNKPNLLYLHICDDIRYEEGGKLSIMGLYNSSIYLPQVPYIFSKFCFYSRFEGIKQSHLFNFKIIDPTGEETKVIENSPCDPEESQNQGIFNVVASPFKLGKAGIHEMVITIVDLEGDGIEGRLFEDGEIYSNTYTYSQKFSVIDLSTVTNES